MPDIAKVKVLTVKQPWASLFFIGKDAKDTENRGWATDYRGELFIHAGKAKDKAEFEAAAALCWKWINGEAPSPPWGWVRIMDLLVNWWRGIVPLPYGGIIGRVNLADIVTASSSPWYEPGNKGWVFKDPVRVPFVACKGKQKLWEMDREAVEG